MEQQPAVADHTFVVRLHAVCILEHLLLVVQITVRTEVVGEVFPIKVVRPFRAAIVSASVCVCVSVCAR